MGITAKILAYRIGNLNFANLFYWFFPYFLKSKKKILINIPLTYFLWFQNILYFNIFVQNYMAFSYKQESVSGFIDRLVNAVTILYFNWYLVKPYVSYLEWTMAKVRNKCALFGISLDRCTQVKNTCALYGIVLYINTLFKGEQRYLKRKNGVDMVYEKSICALGVIFYQKYNVKLLFNKHSS